MSVGWINIQLTTYLNIDLLIEVIRCGVGGLVWRGGEEVRVGVGGVVCVAEGRGMIQRQKWVCGIRGPGWGNVGG